MIILHPALFPTRVVQARIEPCECERRCAGYRVEVCHADEVKWLARASADVYEHLSVDEMRDVIDAETQPFEWRSY